MKIYERILQSEISALEDCIYYNNDTLTGNQVLNISGITTNFKASFITHFTASNGRASWLNIGGDSNNLIFFGQVGSTTLGIFKKVNGQNTGLTTRDVLRESKDYNMEFTYEDGALTLKCDYTTLTASYTYTGRSYVSTNIDTNNIIKNLKIKPL